LYQRAHTLAGDETEAEAWRERTEKLRTRERFEGILEDVLVNEPQSFWARVVRAYRFAQRGNWSEAEFMISRLQKEAPDEPFVRDLAAALAGHSELPALERLPVVQH
jgi:hypothetical protein